MRTFLAHLIALTLVCHGAADSLPSAWIGGGIATFYGGAPDGMDPNQPSFGTLNVRRSTIAQQRSTTQQGACGFGLLDKNSWPGWNVAGISTSNRFYSRLPGNACGACFEIQCVDTRAGVCNTQKTVTIVRGSLQ